MGTVSAMDVHPLRAVVLAVAAVGAVVAAYLGVVTGQVLLGAKEDAPEGAGAIVVLGAAQYDGVPSPALATRLEHALELWRADVASLLVVTGGRRPGDRFHEATAARTWLHARGVPEERIRREVHSRNTYDQIAATTRFLQDEGVERVVLVSDPLHATRLRKIADEVGLDAQVSPTPSPQGRLPDRAMAAAREVGAVAAGQVIGFRRLRNVLEAAGADAEA
jgi:uncharacterized SAM-binding protein YcdF (DUF218 family)